MKLVIICIIRLLTYSICMCFGGLDYYFNPFLEIDNITETKVTPDRTSNVDKNIILDNNIISDNNIQEEKPMTINPKYILIGLGIITLVGFSICCVYMYYDFSEALKNENFLEMTRKADAAELAQLEQQSSKEWLSSLLVDIKEHSQKNPISCDVTNEIPTKICENISDNIK